MLFSRSADERRRWRHILAAAHSPVRGSPSEEYDAVAARTKSAPSCLLCARTNDADFFREAPEPANSNRVSTCSIAIDPNLPLKKYPLGPLSREEKSDAMTIVQAQGRVLSDLNKLLAERNGIVFYLAQEYERIGQKLFEVRSDGFLFSGPK